MSNWRNDVDRLGVTGTGHVRRFPSVILLLVLVALAGCGSGGPSSPTAAPRTSAGPGSSGAGGSPSAAASAAGDFAFGPADILDYYRSLGYACADPKPSTVAAGYTVATCQQVDSAGRTRVVGLVTAASGRLGNAYAAVFGAAGESYLDPDTALDPLAAFLGATLGDSRGGDAAVWLREHLGAAFEKTTFGPLTVATYTGPGDDPSRLYVEIADQAYLAASPVPSR